MKFVATKTPRIVKKLFPNYIWAINTKCQNLYLTFDDGPTPEITPWVLKQLKIYNAKATFFCIGKNIDQYPLIFEQTVREGHTVGNHTYSHHNGWKVGLESYIDQVEKCQSAMDAILSKGEITEPRKIKTKYFRPPYGKIKPSQGKALIKLNYKLIMWDVVAYDWRTTISPQICLRNVIENSENGSIIVLHDSLKASINLKYVLPKILEHFTELGFSFKALA